MTYQEYLAAAQSFEAAEPPSAVQIPALENYDCTKLVHYALGIATEALELVCAVKAAKAFDEQRLELSDILWFSALACNELGIDITEEEIHNNRSPKNGVFLLADTCEHFASRIKAALIYGTPVKPSDPDEDYWRRLPKQIFLHACAIGDASLGNGKLMDLNIAKLKKRYPSGGFSAAAAVNREEWQVKNALSKATLRSEVVKTESGVIGLSVGKEDAAVHGLTVGTPPARIVDPPPAKPIGKTPEIVKMIELSKPPVQ